MKRLSIHRVAGLLVAAVCLLGNIAASVRADVIIYADAFTRTGALLADVPDTRLGLYGGSASATWGGADFTLAGDKVNETVLRGAATLPFVPEAGHVYTLSVTVNVTTPSGNPGLALGYSAGAGASGNEYYSVLTAQAWMLMRGPTGGPNKTWYGGGTANGLDIGSERGTRTISIVLDTNPALWTLDWKVDGVSQRTAAFTTNPTISSVSFGRNDGAAGTFDDFALTVDVPEPATLGLLTLGGLMMVNRCKR
ncbi:MAG: PEP-CTERM sorting domain-containing protein [Phycisphaerales bacterium]